MKNKGKIIIAVFIFILGSIACMYFSIYLHTLLSHQEISVHTFKIKNSIDILKNNKNALKLFGCLELLVIIGSIFYVIKNDEFYESDLITITSDIKIPVPVGQNQHGSARFATDAEKEEMFCVGYVEEKMKGSDEG